MSMFGIRRPGSKQEPGPLEPYSDIFIETPCNASSIDKYEKLAKTLDISHPW
jgi:hypothetical protein